MADISMCMNDKCPSRMVCYRYMAKPNPFWQSYCRYEHNGEKCNSFIKLDKRKNHERNTNEPT